MSCLTFTLNHLCDCSIYNLVFVFVKVQNCTKEHPHSSSIEKPCSAYLRGKEWAETWLAHIHQALEPKH